MLRELSACSVDSECNQPADQTDRCRPIEGFKNRHLSVSRLKNYEQCPLAFRFRYVDEFRVPRDPSAYEMGTLVHEALEAVYRWVIAEEFVGKVPDDVISQSYRNAFTLSGVTTVEFFEEGLEMVRKYFRTHSWVDHQTVLDVEREFNLRVGDFWVNGYIDRIEKPADDEIHVIDYKSNRFLFTQDEIDADLQASIYIMVAKEFFPWAKKFRFGFDMLRFNQRLWTERDDAKLSDAWEYINSLGKRSELSDNGYPAKLNRFCGWCDYRTLCGDYKLALQKLPESVVDIMDIHAVARERERVAAIEKIADTRKKDLEKVLKKYLEKHEKLVVDGQKYNLVQYFSKRFPTEATIRTIALRAGVPEDDVRKELLVIDASKIDDLIGRLEMKPATRTMLGAELQAIAERKPQRPRIDVRKA